MCFSIAHRSYDVDPNTLRQIRKTKWTVVTPGILHPVKMIVTPNVVVSTVVANGVKMINAPPG